MRIGYDGRKALMSGGSEGVYSRNLIKSITNSFPENDYFLFSDNTGRYHVKDFSNREAKVKTIHPEGTLHNFLTFYWQRIGIGKQIFETKLNAYHGLTGDVPAELPPGKKAAKIISLHQTKSLLDFEKRSFLDRFFLKKEFLDKIRKADKVIVPSLSAEEIIRSHFPQAEKKLFVLHNPIADDFFADSQEPAKGDPFYYLPQEFILTTAALEQSGNIEILFEAYKRIYLQSISILPLFVVSRETTYSNQLKNYARELGLEKKIFFLPKINSMLLRFLYKKANLVVIPTARETSGHLLMEAMATNSNFIASDINVHREIAPDGIPYFDKNDVDDLTEKMTSFFEDNNSFALYKSSINQLCHNFRPEIFAKRLNDFYFQFD